MGRKNVKSMPTEAEADGQNISKSTNKAVTQMRIREIEKSVRSMSSILDTRTMFEIENVHKKQTASKKLTAAGKRSANERRGNNNVQAAILNQGLLAAAALKEGGQKLAETTEEYGNEENIWKHKYRTPSYTQKRRFNNPKLHEYYRSLNGEEQKDFKQQCRDSLYAVSNTMRENVSETKAKMDERGVFHPSANAHRAHCAYLLRVYKEVDATTIEDPVLKNMRKQDKYAAMVDETESFGTDSLDSPVREVKRGPVFRDTLSSHNKIRTAKNPRVFEKKVAKKSLSSMFDMVAMQSEESSNEKGKHVRMSEDVDSNTRSAADSANASAANSSHNTPAPTRQNSRRNLELSPARPLSRAQTPSREKMSEMANNSTESSDGPPRPMLRRSNTNKSVRMQDESGNMEGFADSHTTDWMINRLQQEQMAAVVNSSGEPISIPLGKDGQLSWKNLPELKHTKSEPALTGSHQRPLSPVISFSQFNELFKSYNDQIPEQEDKSDPPQPQSSGCGKALFVNTRADHPDSMITPITPKNISPKNMKSLPSVSSKGGGSNRNGQPPKLSKKDSMSDLGLGDESQRIMNSMQPHLDAFIAVNVSKKSNNISMVQKMLAGVKKSGGVMPRASTADARMSRRPGGVSDVGRVAVASLKSGKRVRSVNGFRNVFMAPESDDEESDDESEASEAVESQTSSSEDSSEYDSDEDVAVMQQQQQQQQQQKTRKLQRKKTEKKLKVEDSSVIQERQMTIWEVLEIKTEDRVKLMNKYSSDEHSAEFRIYFSLWTEVALLVLLRQELKKVFQWYQRGLLPMPLNNPEGNLWMFQEVLRRIPPLLKGTYTTATRNKKSVRAETPYFVLEKARGFLTFEEDEEQELGFDYPKSILPFLHSTVKHFDRLLLDKLNEAESKLEDVIPFGAGTCKEWLMSKAQKFPVPTMRA